MNFSTQGFKKNFSLFPFESVLNNNKKLVKRCIISHLETPGPKWWPILGSAVEVARLRRKTGYLFKTCSVLCKKYGPVVGLKIGTDRIVVLNDYESIHAMLTDEDCDGRPIGPVYETRTFGMRRGKFTFCVSLMR